QIIQSTANYTADSLTLLVSLDASNRAHGVNYTDSGEGYSYQSGAYLMREFNIQPLGTDSLILTATVDSGSLSTSTNRYRVGIVTPTGINYTNWVDSNIVKIPLSVTGEAPYGGTAWPIPGTIQAENYDIGGQGIAYYDTDTANDGGQYRTTESVDVETCTDAGGGYDVGFTATGEWEKYTVNVTSAGAYTLQARVASITAGNSLHVEIDGVNISGSIAVPNTTGFQTWQTASVTTPVLAVGKHIMRIYMETGGFNLNYVTFVLNAPAIPAVTSATLAGTVGSAFSYTIAATNGPTSYSLTTGTLPAGLTLNTATGLISGTPTAVGTSTVTVTATNAAGGGTGTLIIAIANPLIPVITSAASASGVINSAFSYTIAASNSPVSYTVTGTLPPGVTFSGTTISGTPTAIGTFIDTVKATNAGGTGIQILTITIAAFAPCSTSMIINATSVPIIDGTVDPVWSNAPKNAITNTIQGVIQTGSTWQSMYDATNLYVLVQVKDANTSSVGTNVYDRDGVELFIAGNNNKTNTYTANDHQYRFNWNVAATTANITGDAPLVTTGITYAIPSAAGGYNLEVAIPWTTI
ncbi:MAG TPA: sugar-binding protein, partial [Bacteroidia bacterium]|nr:sugar-binding protein [Bacteroidia bacterium]